MVNTPGKNLAQLLDRGVDLLPMLPTNEVAGLAATYFSRNHRTVTFRPAGHLNKLDQPVRLSIMGAVIGASYTPEQAPKVPEAEDIVLPDGTSISVPDLDNAPLTTGDYQLPSGAVAACIEISNFIRGLFGDVFDVSLRFDTDEDSTIRAMVCGRYESGAAYADYMASLQRGVVVNEAHYPVTANHVPCTGHEVLTPASGHLISLAMSDHRPGAREEMLRLNAEQQTEH